jgi:hypothetical protein
VRRRRESMPDTCRSSEIRNFRSAMHREHKLRFKPFKGKDLLRHKDLPKDKDKRPKDWHCLLPHYRLQLLPVLPKYLKGKFLKDKCRALLISLLRRLLQSLHHKHKLLPHDRSIPHKTLLEA